MTRPGWSDVDDHGRPDLRRRWRMAPRNPAVEVGPEVAVPTGLDESAVVVPR